MSENYSIKWWFHLLLVATICGAEPAAAQELLWSKTGFGARPHITVYQGDGGKKLVMVGSPFSTKVTALSPSDGQQRWQTDLEDNVSTPGRLVADVAFIATHGGTLLALDSNTGKMIWRRQTERLNDFAAGQPVFIEGSLYTLTQGGVLSRFSITGERIKSRRVSERIGDWIPRLVPMWRDAGNLSYLDQSGRLRTYDKESLDFLGAATVDTAAGPGRSADSSDVLAGVYRAPKDLLWTTELSGALRASSLSANNSLWVHPLGSVEDLWSEQDRLLAIPILASGEFRRVLVVTRHQAWALDSLNGEVQKKLALPAGAVAPPLYDAQHQTWWVVTEDSLLELSWDGDSRVLKLPKMEVPYAAAVAGDILVLASQGGRVYGLSLKAER